MKTQENDGHLLTKEKGLRRNQLWDTLIWDWTKSSSCANMSFVTFRASNAAAFVWISLQRESTKFQHYPAHLGTALCEKIFFILKFMLSKQLRFIMITRGHAKILKQFQNNQRKHITHWKFNAVSHWQYNVWYEYSSF